MEPLENNIAINEQTFNLIEEKSKALIKWHNYLFKEVERTIFQASNTAPGINLIPPKTIQQAWPVYCVEFTKLFQLCLKKGYHLLAFKNIILCALLKPRKHP